jgi:hypothetical protein
MQIEVFSFIIIHKKTYTVKCVFLILKIDWKFRWGNLNQSRADSLGQLVRVYFSSHGRCVLVKTIHYWGGGLTLCRDRLV